MNKLKKFKGLGNSKNFQVCQKPKVFKHASKNRDEKRKLETISMFSRYFDLDELKHIVASVESDNPTFKGMMEEALKRRGNEHQCLNCNKEVDFEAEDCIFLSGKVSNITDKSSLSPFCNANCLKKWQNNCSG